MKKIIATVLAMVMALALCTTAFAAAQTYDVFGKDSDVAIAEEVTVTYNKANADENTIAYYELSGDQFKDEYYVKVTKASDASLVLKYTGKTTVAMYLKEVKEVEYTDGEAAAYTNLGSKCGQVNYKDITGADKKTKFYTATDDNDDVILFSDVTGGTSKLLVNGEVLVLKEVGKLSEKVVAHTWVLDNEKLTAKCSACGATAKVYENYTEVPSGATAEQVAGVWVVADASNTTPSTDKNTSPKTFDAGIAMYVGMALTSAAGSAVVIGKKKEF